MSLHRFWRSYIYKKEFAFERAHRAVPWAVLQYSTDPAIVTFSILLKCGGFSYLSNNFWTIIYNQARLSVGIKYFTNTSQIFLLSLFHINSKAANIDRLVSVRRTGLKRVSTCIRKWSKIFILLQWIKCHNLICWVFAKGQINVSSLSTVPGCCLRY